MRNLYINLLLSLSLYIIVSWDRTSFYLNRTEKKSTCSGISIFQSIPILFQENQLIPDTSMKCSTKHFIFNLQIRMFAFNTLQYKKEKRDNC